MKNNSLLTYVLYGLLGLILIIAGYYACQKQKDGKLKKEQDEAELQQTLRDMGYAQADSNATSGSSFVERDTLKKGTTTKPSVNKNGIEEESSGNSTATKNTNTTTQSPIKPTTSTTRPIAKPSTSTSATGKGVKGPGTGRWAIPTSAARSARPTIFRR